MRRLIGVGFRRFCRLECASVKLSGSILERRRRHGAEMAVAADIGVDAHPLRIDHKLVWFFYD
jgi:hypothetical protein